MNKQITKSLELVRKEKQKLWSEFSKSFWRARFSEVNLLGAATFVIINEFGEVGKFEKLIEDGNDIVIVNDEYIAIQVYNDGKGKPYYYRFVLDRTRGMGEDHVKSVKSIINTPKRFEKLYRQKCLNHFKRRVEHVLKDENRYAFNFIMKDIS